MLAAAMRYWVQLNYKLSEPFPTLQESMEWYVHDVLPKKSKDLSEQEDRLRTHVDHDTKPVVPTFNSLHAMLRVDVWETVADDMPDDPRDDDYWMPDDEQGVRCVSFEEIETAIAAIPGGDEMRQHIRCQFDLIHRLCVAQARFWEENQETWRIVRWHYMRGLTPPPSLIVPSPEANVCDIVLEDSSGRALTHSPFAAGTHEPRTGGIPRSNDLHV